MRAALHTIHLHGALAAFGTEYRLAVNSPAEAVRALASQLKGFGDAMREGYFRLVRGKSPDDGLEYEAPYDEEKKAFDVSMLHFSLGRHDLHIVPVMAGAGGNGGAGKAILGAVIMVAAIVAAPYTGGTSLTGAAAFSFGTGGAAAFAFGASLTLAGIGMMLQPSVKTDYSAAESPEERASFFLGGQVNQNSQGGPVVLAYGKIRIGSTVISAGLTPEKM
jgi:predicted phage tail protein